MQSITRLSLRKVVFFAEHYRENRWVLWNSALHQEFSALEEQGILTINHTPLHFSGEPLPLSRKTALGHDRPISCLIVSPDGRFFASSSTDGTIILWDAHRGTIVYDWVGHWHSDRIFGVHSLAFSPDTSQYLLSSGVNKTGTIRIWDTLRRPVEQVQALDISEGRLAGITDCTWSADGKWIAGFGRYWYSQGEQDHQSKLHVWDACTFRQQFLFTEPGSNNSRPSFSKDSRWLVWSSRTPSDGTTTIRVLDCLALDEPPRMILLHINPDDGLSYRPLLNPTGRSIVTVHDRRLRAWDLITGAPLAIMDGHMSFINSAIFSPDGQYVLSASEDGTARIWLAENGECTHSLQGHVGGLSRAVFSPDGNYIATASHDKTVRVWRIKDELCLATLTGHEHWVQHIVFSPNGRMLASGDEGGVVRIRDISDIIRQ